MLYLVCYVKEDSYDQMVDAPVVSKMSEMGRWWKMIKFVKKFFVGVFLMLLLSLAAAACQSIVGYILIKLGVELPLPTYVLLAVGAICLVNAGVLYALIKVTEDK